MLKRLLFIAALAFACSAIAQYRWIDENGRVQYGDMPPAGAKSSTLRAPASGAQSAPTNEESNKGPQTIGEKEAEFRKRQMEAEKAREKQAQTDQQAADKRENCARAKEAVRTFETGRVVRIDAKGERYFLDEAQLAQESARARKDAQDWCN